jgi:hypothetical protein
MVYYYLRLRGSKIRTYNPVDHSITAGSDLDETESYWISLGIVAHAALLLPTLRQRC